MPSTIIGRTRCHLCGFTAAHVRESEKCLQTFCPDCKTQVIYRTQRQRELFAPLLRADKLAGVDTPQPPALPTEAPSASTPAPQPEPEPDTMPKPTDAAEPPATGSATDQKPKRKPAAPKPAAPAAPAGTPPAPPPPTDRPRASWWGV